MATSGDSLNTIPGLLNVGKINATGTPDATNYLRGDGAWEPAAGGSGLTHPQVLARTLGA